jgi:hypothetical protein
MSSLRRRFDNLDPEEQQYLLNELAAHLSASQQLQRLYALISRDWMELKLVAAGSHQSFAADVDLALQAAMRITRAWALGNSYGRPWLLPS